MKNRVINGGPYTLLCSMKEFFKNFTRAGQMLLLSIAVRIKLNEPYLRCR